MKMPRRWNEAQLKKQAKLSEDLFRTGRLEASEAWAINYKAAREKFERLLEILQDLDPEHIHDTNLAKVYSEKLGEALRYLAGPPISDDDLQTIADVASLAPTALSKDLEALRKVYGVIKRVIDPYRFPWFGSGKPPSRPQREMAILASAVLLAAQRVATQRRNDGKAQQETRVQEYLTSIGMTQVRPVAITTIVRGPSGGQFCAECKLGTRKADIVVRLPDTRVMAIECKVSNSVLNSVKRVNNDAAAKAEAWLARFGTDQVVPAAMLSGVFGVNNLMQAQERGLSLFWAHDLARLGAFVRSAK